MRVVQSGTADFEAILVYDVSRWGRFQDADEGAYHEHLCSRAGIRVHYCGEQFDNDGSIGSILLKNVKRVMAGEYSRELSVKVFAGQCRLVELGFRQGGPAGYGLRRQLIDERRQPKAELRRGERKSLQTDRVVLGLGPQDEIDHVRRIYTMFVDDGLSEQEIASRLNNEGILTDFDRKWLDHPCIKSSPTKNTSETMFSTAFPSSSSKSERKQVKAGSERKVSIHR